MDKASKFSCPSFFKLLMDDDINHGIRIPHSFVIELEKSESPGNYSLFTGENRRSSNPSWPVKLEKKGHYYYVREKSWPLFVRDYSLEHGDCLLFHLTGKTKFFVTPYAPNGSKKMLCNDDDSSSDDDEDSDTSKSESGDARVSKKRGTKTQIRFSDPASKKLKIDTRDYHQVRMPDELGVGTSRSKVKIEPGEHGYNKDGDATSRNDTKEMMRRAEEDEEIDGYYDSSAEKPYFIMTLKQDNRSRVRIPIHFAMEANLDKAAGEVELRCDGAQKKSWTAKIVRNNGRMDIGKGWNDFRKQFGIELGETYRFVIVNRRDPITMSVHKYTPNDRRKSKKLKKSVDHGDDVNEPGGTSGSKVKFSGDHHGYKDEETEKMNGSYDLRADNPCFIRTIKEHNRSFVCVPMVFAKWLNLDKVKEVVLRWGDEANKKTWTAKVVERNYRRIDIGAGWSAFRRDSGIKFGDTCRFTVVNLRDPTTISVQIYRSN